MTTSGRLALAVLLNCAVVACSTTAGSPTPSPPRATPAPSPTTTPIPTIDPDTCPVPPQADVILAVSVGSEPNAGKARATLCLDGEAPIDMQFATCTWLPDRASVRLVDALSQENLPSWSLFVDQSRDPDRALTVHRRVVDNEPGASYTPAISTQLIEAVADGGTSGAIRFLAIPRADTNPLPEVPATVSGVFRWACDDPPPPVAGESTGWVRLDIDGGSDPVRTVEATCRWVLLDGTPILFNLGTSGLAYRFGDLDAGISINRNSLGAHELPEVHLSMSDPEMGGFDLSGPWRYPLSLSADQSSGAIRFRGFTYELGFDREGLPEISAGIVIWHCDRPIAGPPDAPERYEAHEPPLTVTGTGVLRLGHPLDDDLPATVTCVIQGPDPVSGPSTAEIVEVRIEAAYRDERLIYTSMWNEGVLIRLDRSGQPLGEYVTTSGAGWGGAEPGAGPIQVQLGLAAFEPTDPRFIPLGGAGGPERFALTITVDCPAA